MTQNLDQNRINLNPNVLCDMIIPVNVFNIGFKLKYTFYYENNLSNYEEIYEDNSVIDKDIIKSNDTFYYNIIEGNILLSWKINEIISVGLTNGIKSLINYYYDEKSNDDI
jgi:hypothetical protein